MQSEQSELRKSELHSDAVPVRMVIFFVGAIGVLSLLIAAGLFWMGKTGEGVLAITNGCVMGLLGLLARTETRQRQQDQSAQPIEVTATQPLPVEVAQTDETDGETDDEPLQRDVQRDPLSKTVRR